MNHATMFGNDDFSNESRLGPAVLYCTADYEYKW